MKNKIILSLVVLYIGLTLVQCSSEGNVLQFYVGTYTQKEGHVDGVGHGIYKIGVDPAKAKIKILDSIGGLVNPSYIYFDSQLHRLIAVNETADKNGSGWISLIDVGEDHFGTILDTLHTLGGAPCHIGSDHQDGIVYCNYMGGVGFVKYDADSFKDHVHIDFSDSTASTHHRQEASHPHQSLTLPNGTYTYVSDLGTDKIWIVSHDTRSEAMHPYLQLPLGSGPRHMTYDPNSQLLYILNELDNSVVVAHVNVDNGSLHIVHESMSVLSHKDSLSTSADIHLCKDRNVLYTSTRGQDIISIFDVNDKPTNIGQVSTMGKTPRNFVMSQDGAYLIAANQDTRDIAVYEVGERGLLNYLFIDKVPTPVCLVEIDD